MSDFVIEIGHGARPDSIIQALRNRPSMHERPVRMFDFPWGRVVVQASANKGYEPFEDGRAVYFCVGRPLLIGTTDQPGIAHSFLPQLAARWSPDALDQVSASLSGAFVLARCDLEGIAIITDQMGIRPVYMATNSSGRLQALGTVIDPLAALAGRSMDFDRVSIGELLLHGHITFPYTTRLGISEANPASSIEVNFSPQGMSVRRQTFWQPREPERWDTRDHLAQELEHALRLAGKELSNGLTKIAITLSGGRDSRAVLSLIPRDRLAGAITFVTRRNRETDVAERAARACGVPHVLAQRPPNFYPRLMERTVALQGSEQRAQAHGFGVVDSGLDTQFDLIVGGQLGDTYLKGYLMSERTRHGYGVETASGDVGLLKRTLRRFRGVAGSADSKVDRNRRLLVPEITEEISSRRRQRHAEVAKVRPGSAEEWIAVWPTSRGITTPSHIQGNSRLYAADLLFAHRSIIDVASRIPPELRAGGRLAHEVYSRLYDERLLGLEDANTGLPIGTDDENRLPPRRDSRSHPDDSFRRLSRSETPWNDVQSSWADMGLMQQCSPDWAALRRRLAASPAVDVMGSFMTCHVPRLISHYDKAAGSSFNHAMIQLVFYLDRVICGLPISQSDPLPS
jgi:hypothetical protein